MCFVRISIDILNGKEVYEYACIGHDNMAEGCLDGPVVMDFTSMQCCNHADECNERLRPPIPLGIISSSQPASIVTTQMINIASPPETGTIVIIIMINSYIAPFMLLIMHDRCFF